MAIVIRQLSICVVLAATLLTTGCTNIYRIPDVSLRNQGSEYSVDKKINLAVNLCLTDELKAAKWEKHIMGDTYIIPIGNQLAKNASELSDILFRDVVVTSTPVPVGTRHADAVLTPRVIAIERSYGATAFGESILTIVFEWKLEDSQSNPIWVDSIKGEGRLNVGNYFTHKGNAEEQVEMLLKDLFGKSFQAMKASPEIRQFVARKQLQQE